MINRIVICGRLTRDPDLKTTSNGVAVANFTVACDDNYKDQNGDKKTNFIPIVAWRGLAETCGRYCSKGKLVAVDGKLQIRSYDDKDGNKRTVAEIVADNVQFLSPKGESAGTDQGYYPDEPMGEEMTPLDEIPF